MKLKTKETDPVAREGFPILGAGLALMVAGLLLHPIVFLAAFCFFLFSLYFFRNPKRVTPADEHLMVSPADGKVIFVGPVKESRFLNKECMRVSVFMSPFNVHVNRMPVTGTVRLVSYHKGKFFPAYADKASLENEQNAVILEDRKGRQVLFVQIAGWLARRVICHAAVGEIWKKGDIYGIIRFGSRMDIYFPDEYEVTARVGDIVAAGETVIATERTVIK